MERATGFEFIESTDNFEAGSIRLSRSSENLSWELKVESAPGSSSLNRPILSLGKTGARDAITRNTRELSVVAGQAVRRPIDGALQRWRGPEARQGVADHRE